MYRLPVIAGLLGAAIALCVESVVISSQFMNHRSEALGSAPPGDEGIKSFAWHQVVEDGEIATNWQKGALLFAVVALFLAWDIIKISWKIRTMTPPAPEKP